MDQDAFHMQVRKFMARVEPMLAEYEADLAARGQAADPPDPEPEAEQPEGAQNGDPKPETEQSEQPDKPRKRKTAEA